MFVGALQAKGRFNPSTGLMLISTLLAEGLRALKDGFQSLDWVDVDFDIGNHFGVFADCLCFNPSTGLMLISTAAASGST